MTESAERALKNAYALLKNTTPLENVNCGCLCSSACCGGDENDCVFLFPYEDELVKGNGFTICETEGNFGFPALSCNGECNRNFRPLGCRIFPLFPMILPENGHEKIVVITDPRASICPLTLENARISPKFVRAVRRAGIYLMRDPENNGYMKRMTNELLEIIELRNKLEK
ncbi:MAG: hypothetical protein II702_06380 [Clostridia bacterium]|nr:hypothetical protein [Clostridia bacterium]